MAFDINEARAIIEEAKKRGLISDANSQQAAKPAATSESASKTPAKNVASSAVIPDWLREAIADPSPQDDSNSRDSIFSSRE